MYELYKEKDVEEITKEELSKYSVIRLGTEYDFYIDIIGAIEEVFNYEKIESIDKVIEGHRIRLASPRSLFEMKSNTYREIDTKDLLFLQHYIKNSDESKKI